MATVFERVKRIIVEQLGVKEDDVVPKASFVEDFNAESLDLVELIMATRTWTNGWKRALM